MAMTFLCIAIVEALVLAFIAATDIAYRIIPNWACVVIALVGGFGQLLHGPLQLAISFSFAMALFVLMLFVPRIFGGGDVKLFVALVIGLPFTQIGQLFIVTAYAGGILAVIHFALRYALRYGPRPHLPAIDASTLRRVWAVERWRILRKGPLPYGVAIACGGIWTVMTTSFGG